MRSARRKCLAALAALPGALFGTRRVLALVKPMPEFHPTAFALVSPRLSESQVSMVHDAMAHQAAINRINSMHLDMYRVYHPQPYPITTIKIWPGDRLSIEYDAKIEA